MIRRRTCVVCLTKWETEYSDEEMKKGWVEWVRCPICRGTERENKVL